VIFRTRPDRPWVPPSLLYNRYRFSSPGVKRPGCDVDHPPPSSAEVKERVELYVCFPSGPSWPVLGRSLPFYSPLNQHKRQFYGHELGSHVPRTKAQTLACCCHRIAEKSLWMSWDTWMRIFLFLELWILNACSVLLEMLNGLSIRYCDNHTAFFYLQVHFTCFCRRLVLHRIPLDLLQLELSDFSLRAMSDVCIIVHKTHPHILSSIVSAPSFFFWVGGRGRT
jgi:hypothetical protein